MGHIVKRFSYTIVISAIATCLISCALDIDDKGGVKGNGSVQKVNRPIEGSFDTILSSEDLNVFVSPADEYEIVIEADENIIDLIGTDIKNGKLHVHTHRGIGRATKNIYVKLPNIAALKSATGSRLQTLGIIEEDSLFLESSTGSSLKTELRSNFLSVEGKEGSRIVILGDAKNTKFNVSSGSSINAKMFQTQNCIASASFGGNLELKVSQSLIADSNTGGLISYYGEPTVDKEKSMSGSVEKY